MISREAVNAKVKTKEHYYQGMLSFGFLMPDFKQPFVTLKHMQLIRQGLLWVPLQSDMPREFSIPRKPTKQQLAQMLVDQIQIHLENNPQLRGTMQYQGMSKLIRAVIKRPPNQDWLVRVIGILNPRHQIFAPDYMPPQRPLAQNPPIMFDNNDGFFDNLPDLQGKALKHRGLPMPKHVKLQQEIARAERAKQIAKAKIALLRQQQMDEISQIMSIEDSSIDEENNSQIEQSAVEIDHQEEIELEQEQELSHALSHAHLNLNNGQQHFDQIQQPQMPLLQNQSAPGMRQFNNALATALITNPDALRPFGFGQPNIIVNVDSQSFHSHHSSQRSHHSMQFQMQNSNPNQIRDRSRSQHSVQSSSQNTRFNHVMAIQGHDLSPPVLTQMPPMNPGSRNGLSSAARAAKDRAAKHQMLKKQQFAKQQKHTGRHGASSSASDVDQYN